METKQPEQTNQNSGSQSAGAPGSPDVWKCEWCGNQLRHVRATRRDKFYCDALGWCDGCGAETWSKPNRANDESLPDCCESPGLTMESDHVEQMPDGTWEARAKFGAIFGAEVEGECTGKGATKEEALAALKKDQDGLQWACRGGV